MSECSSVEELVLEPGLAFINVVFSNSGRPAGGPEGPLIDNSKEACRHARSCHEAILLGAHFVKSLFCLRGKVRRNVIWVFSLYDRRDLVERFVIAPNSTALVAFFQLDMVVQTIKKWKQKGAVHRALTRAWIDCRFLRALLNQSVKPFETIVRHSAKLPQLADIKPDAAGLWAYIERDAAILNRLQRKTAIRRKLGHIGYCSRTLKPNSRTLKRAPQPRSKHYSVYSSS